MTDDLVQNADGFRLGVRPSDDDVYHANWVIDRQSARILADAEVIKAAEELAEQCEAAFDGVDAVGPREFYKALAAFNEAVKGEE